VHDSKEVGRLLDAKVVQQEENAEATENLCLDAGYTGKADEAAMRGYVPHIRPRNKEAKEIRDSPGFKARRWVVEASHSWMNRFRKLAPRYEKTDLSYCALLHLAAAMITLNKVSVICG
jgi:transposase